MEIEGWRRPNVKPPFILNTYLVQKVAKILTHFGVKSWYHLERFKTFTKTFFKSRSCIINLNKINSKQKIGSGSNLFEFCKILLKKNDKN